LYLLYMYCKVFQHIYSRQNEREYWKLATIWDLCV
jgi:hypothetical protein